MEQRRAYAKNYGILQNKKNLVFSNDSKKGHHTISAKKSPQSVKKRLSLRVKMIIVYICICYINTDKEGSKYAFHHNNIIFTYNFSHYLIPYEIITSKL